MAAGRLACLLVVALAAAVAHAQVRVGSKTYFYHSGGRDWDGLCAAGTRQSPINIVEGDAAVVLPRDPSKHRVDFSGYNDHSKARTRHSAYDVTVLPVKKSRGQLGSINVSGVIYNVTFIRMHSPAEHSINGHIHGAEAEIFHQNAKGETLIVSVLFALDERTANLNASAPLMKKLKLMPGPRFLKGMGISKALPRMGHARISSALLGALRPELSASDYFMYSGSLSVPPCTEGITRVVFGNALSMTKSQFDVLESLFTKRRSFANGHGNNRLRPRMERAIEWIWPPSALKRLSLE